MKKYGLFKDDSTFVVTELYTEVPYTNMLHNRDGYLAEINQWGTTTSSVQFSDLETCTVNPQNAKVLYLRNEHSKKVWCIGAEPLHSQVKDYFCEHGDGYSLVSSRFEGIHASVRIFVPGSGRREIWSVTLTNEADTNMQISAVPAALLDMTGYSGVRFATGPHSSYITDYHESMNAIYFKGGNPNQKGKPYDAFLAASEKADYFSGDDRRFLAAPRDMSYPRALMNGENLDSKACASGEPFIAIQCVLSLAPGETKELHFMFGTSRNEEEAAQMCAVLKDPCAVEELYQHTVKRLTESRKSLEISTPDKKIDRFINVWLKKGMEYCLRKKDATRDNIQFAMGLLYAAPQKVRDTLILAMRHQFQDGHTVRSWLPMDKTVYSDGQIWLVLLTCDYIKFSGDTAFLGEIIPYIDGGEGSVLEHIERGVERLNADRGPHNLCLAHFADWNDALNLDDENAESVFTSMGFAWCLKEMEALCTAIGIDASKYAQMHRQIKHIINETCWDEAGYYIRGYSKGKKIGASNSEGSKIYVNPQTWAILSDVVPDDRKEQLIKAVDTLIETNLGCMVNAPAYESFSPELGRISFQLPGTVENGAVYCHATGFKINADVQLGRGSAALKDIKKIMPDSEWNPCEESGALPYALTSSYCTNPIVYGKAGRSWLTGTQGWLMRCVVEGLLGIKKTYGGFIVEPAFPDEWKEASCTIIRQDTHYHFSVCRTANKAIYVDGEKLEGKFFPFSKKEHVEIRIEI